jgi:NADPH2:quinone reductase
MRTVGLFTHGGPEVLQVVELPEVHAGPGQVRIRVHAATVNPTDVATRNGTRAEQQKADPPPYVPGMESAGIVDEVGSGVPDRLKLGDAVMAIAVPKGSHGAYRERIGPVYLRERRYSHGGVPSVIGFRCDQSHAALDALFWSSL